jgi:hypothetical protein
MHCRFNNIAYLYPNDMLSREEKSRFEAHLPEWGECKAIVAQEKQVRNLYRESVLVKPPEGFEEGVFYRLAHEKKKREPAGNVTKVIFTRRIIPGAALLAAAMLFIIFLTPQQTDMKSEPSSNANYASIYFPGDDQYIISDDGNASYNDFLSSLNQSYSSNEANQGM